MQNLTLMLALEIRGLRDTFAACLLRLPTVFSIDKRSCNLSLKTVLAAMGFKPMPFAIPV